MWLQCMHTCTPTLTHPHSHTHTHLVQLSLSGVAMVKQDISHTDLKIIASAAAQLQQHIHRHLVSLCVLWPLEQPRGLERKVQCSAGWSTGGWREQVHMNTYSINSSPCSQSSLPLTSLPPSHSPVTGQAINAGVVIFSSLVLSGGPVTRHQSDRRPPLDHCEAWRSQSTMR